MGSVHSHVVRFQGQPGDQRDAQSGLLTLKGRISSEGRANMFLSSDLYQKHGTDVKDLCFQSDGPREPRIHQNSGTRGLSLSLHRWEPEFGVSALPPSVPGNPACCARACVSFLTLRPQPAASARIYRTFFFFFDEMCFWNWGQMFKRAFHSFITIGKI